MVKLSSRYRNVGWDPLVPTDLLVDEINQLRETGYEVEEYIERANAIDPRDRAAVLAIVDDMANAQRTRPWPYEEPDDLTSIEASWGEPSLQLQRPTDDEIRSRMRSAWLGRIAGCNIGKPIELGTHWTMDHIRDYLERAHAYPLDDYMPVLEPMPDSFELRDNWPDTTRGRVNGSARDDDIDYPILGLYLLEKHGAALSPQHVADAWTALFPIRQVFTAERAAYINIVEGQPIELCARRRNPYREWIGAQIRGDIFGYVFPGEPAKAARLAYQDASLSHVGNGIYGEMWSAALISCCFATSSAREAIEASLAYVPQRSRLSEALRWVLELRDQEPSWERAIAAVRERYGHYNWIHTINNAALVTAGALWGEDDYTKSVCRTVMGGWDTDSNGATAGSIAGILAGPEGLSAHIIDPLHDRTRSAVFGFDNSRISELASRATALALDGLPTDNH